jgi:hypothetical protein
MFGASLDSLRVELSVEPTGVVACVGVLGIRSLQWGTGCETADALVPLW